MNRTATQLKRRIAYLERAIAKIQASLAEADTLLRRIGFCQGLATVKLVDNQDQPGTLFAPVPIKRRKP